MDGSAKAGSLLDDLGLRDRRPAAFARLAEAPLADVLSAVPTLVLLAALHPNEIKAIAAPLRRLDHDKSCRLLLDSMLNVLHRLGSTPNDHRSLADQR